MRGFGQIGDHRIARNVLTQSHGQFGFGFLEHRRLEYRGQANHLTLRIGQFQTHAGFARDGFHHAYRSKTQRARQVFFQIHHLRAAHTGGGLDFIAGNHRASVSIGHAHIDFKLGQFFFDDDAVVNQHLIVWTQIGVVYRRLQQLHIRQHHTVVFPSR